MALFDDLNSLKKKRQPDIFGQFDNFFNDIRSKRQREAEQADSTGYTPVDPSQFNFQPSENKSGGFLDSLFGTGTTMSDSNDNSFINIQKKIYDNTLGPVQDFFNRVAATGAKSTLMHVADKGMEQEANNGMVPESIKQALQPAQSTSDKVADFLGEGIGFIGPGEAAYKIGGNTLLKGFQKVAPSAPKIAQDLVRGAGAGLAYGTANEALDAGLDTRNDGEQSIGQRLGNIGLDATMFGGGDAAFGAVGKLLERFKKPTEAPLNELMLEQPKVEMNAQKPIEPFIPNETRANIDLPKIPKQEPVNVMNELDAMFGPNEGKIAFEEMSAKRNKPKVVRVNDIPVEDANKFVATTAEIPDTTGHIVSKTDKPGIKEVLSSIPSKANQGYISTVDNLYRLKQFENAAGESLKPSEQPYTLALNSRGSDMVASQIVNKNMVNAQGEVVGKSFADLTKQIPKGQDKLFEDYLINRHAVTRMNRGESVFPKELDMTPEKSQSKVLEYDKTHPHFAELAKQYDEYNNQLGKTWLVDTGLITEKQWNQWREENPYYAPNQRKFEDIERKGPNKAKNGFVDQKSPVKKATGSERPIISPIESTIENTEKYVKVAKRNEVGKAILKILERNPEELQGFAEIVNESNKMDIDQLLKSEGIDGLVESLSEPIDKSLHSNDPLKGAVVTVLRDGQPVKIKINDMQMLEAVSSLQPKAQNVIIGSLGKLTRVMKTLTTGINPIFSLTRNVFRDIPMAYVASKTTHNPLRFTWDLVDSMISVMGNKELYESFKNIGGGHSSSISSNRNMLSQSKNKLLNVEGFLPNAKKKAEKVFHFLENINNAVESAPRLGEYKRALKQGEGSYDSKIKGLFEANDVTVNFNRYGNVTKEVDAVIPYMNAAAQGLDKVLRTFGKGESKTAVATAWSKAFLALTVPTVWLYSINHKDPNYQQLSEQEKDTFFHIPKGDGTFWKIAKPREASVVFSAGVERIFRQWQDKDPNAFDNFAITVRDSFMPPTRSVLAPLSDIRANKDFADRAIVPMDLQKLSPENQYDTRTSEIGKGLGKLTGQSPKNIDYLIKSYGGVIGQLGLPATTKNANIGDVLERQVTADPAFSNDISRKFYDLKEKLDRAEADFKHTDAKSADYNKALRLKLDRASDDMSDARKKIKKIEADQKLSSDQKEKLTRDLQLKINNIAMKAIGSVK